MTTKIIKVEGKRIKVPADATDEDIQQILEMELGGVDNINTPVADRSQYGDVIEITGGVNSPEQTQQPVPDEQVAQANTGLPDWLPDYLKKGILLSREAEAAAKPMLRSFLGDATPTNMFGAGSPFGRVVKGAVVDPSLGIYQFMANTGLFGNELAERANRTVRNVDAYVDKARAEQQGSTGFDGFQLLGNVVSPFNYLFGGSTAAAKAPSLVDRVKNAAGVGGTIAAIQPVNAPDEDFASKKSAQIILGNIFGGGTQLGLSAIGKVGEMFKGLTANGRTEALKEYLNSLAGRDREKVIRALQDAKELVSGSRPTAAEAIADIPTAAEIAAAQANIAGKKGIAGKFAERSVEQQAARIRALENIAGTEAQRAALVAERNGTTAGMREDALKYADVAGQVQPRLEKQINSLFAELVDTQNKLKLGARSQPSFLPKSVVDERLGGLADKAKNIEMNMNMKQFQIKSLADNGFFPLKVDGLVKNIDDMLARTTQDETRAVLQGVKAKIMSKKDENGIISSRELYENIRKPSNADIAKFLGLSDSQFANGGIPKNAASAANNVKNMVDASLNKSSEGLWSKYLNTYKTYSERLNRMEVGDYLAKQLRSESLNKETLGKFAGAVDNAARTIERSTGIPRYEKLSDVLTKEEVAAVNNVAADLARLSNSKSLGRMVKEMQDVQPNIAGQAPATLNRTVTFLKSMVEHIQRGNAEKFNQRLSELMLEPAEMAKFMTQTVPKNRLNEFTSSMMKMMNDSNRQAFIQSFTIPYTAKEGVEKEVNE